MRGAFDDEDAEPEKPRRDTELTLGNGTLLAGFFGLLLLCGLCFGLGYSLGHRNAAPTAASTPPPQSGDQEPLQASGAIPKPSAAEQTAVAPTQPGGTGQASQAAANPEPGSAAGSTPAMAPQNPDPETQTPAPAAQPGPSAVQPVVRPAPGSAQPAPAAVPNAHPALAPAAQFMVQIAAVTTPEDAEVLMDALRKRGYAVTVRRDLTDNLIHVRIGPFATRSLADQWRQKLLSDGYNAIVQP